MTKLLEDGNYVNLGATDLVNKAAEVIKNREEEVRKLFLKSK